MSFQVAKEAALGFSRLKGIFRSGINYKSYSQIVATSSRPTIGNLPDDLLKLLIRNNSGNRQEAICSIQNIFDDVGKALGQVNKLESQAIMRTEMSKNSLQRTFKYFQKDGDMRFWRQDPLYLEKELESVIKAEETLLKGFRQFLPQTKNVVIKPLGCGQFGNAYKIEIIGEGGQKIIADKVIKIYRDEALFSTFIKKIESFINSKSDNELLNLFQEIRSNLGTSIPKEWASSIKIEKIPKAREEFAQRLAQVRQGLKEANQFHGPAAEANLAEYMRFWSGHKLSGKDGIEIPSLFHLGENPYAISNFIGKNTKATREFSFSRIGLEHGDFITNPSNGINGICIDIGGISAKSDSIIGNKQATRVLKQIENAVPTERKAVFDSLKSKILSKDSSDETIAYLNQIESLVQ